MSAELLPFYENCRLSVLEADSGSFPIGSRVAEQAARDRQSVATPKFSVGMVD